MTVGRTGNPKSAEDHSMSDLEENEAGTHFGGVIPIFRVKDLNASTDYYVTALGFKVDWHYDNGQR